MLKIKVHRHPDAGRLRSYYDLPKVTLHPVEGRRRNLTPFVGCHLSESYTTARKK